MFCLFMFVCFLIALLRRGFPFCLASFFPSFLLAKDLAFMGNNCQTKCCFKR